MSLELKIKVTESEASQDGAVQGQVEIEPLYRGFGHTIGNGLRRVLLARVEGAAVTHVRIEGVNHEFTSVEGASEDVLDVMLNLKQLVVKMETEEERTLILKSSGKGVLSASDIECPEDVKIINPGLEIANLDPKSSMNIEITVRKGRGYVPSEDHEQKAVDVIPVDSVFMPIRNVSYTVEPTTVPGDPREYDRLILDVWSDGSVSVNEAVGQAAAQQIELLNPLIEYTGQKVGVVKTVEEDSEKEEQEEDKVSSVSVEELELSVRSYNCLKRANINTLGDLLKLTEHELMNIKNFGRKSAEEVIEKLKSMGFDLDAKKSMAGVGIE